MPKFLDKEHKQFYEQKVKSREKSDEYRKAIIYTLAICPVTREHFNDIFNVKNGEFNTDSLKAPYQTYSSIKVTKMAYSIWNRYKYVKCNAKLDTDYNLLDTLYSVYATYFLEAIKIMYPEVITYKNTLEDVIELIRSKYQDVVDFNYSNDTLTLEYIYMLNDEKDCYQLIQVREFENKLSIEYVPQHITKILFIDELEDIFEMLQKQCTHKPLKQEEIQVIKDKYVIGTKIKLIKMYDPFSPPPSNTIGIVEFVDDIGQIHIKWNDESSLALVPELDEFEVIGGDEK